MTLDLDLHTTTVAAVKATVDSSLESAWRASGVRILRSDLPFCGIRLRYQSRLLPMDEVLSSCKVGKGMTLYAEWPPINDKNQRRKRYGKGWDDEARSQRSARGKKRSKHAEKKDRREAAETGGSTLVESSAQSVHENDGDKCGDKTELEVGDGLGSDGSGTQGLGEQVAGEEPNEERAEEERQDNGAMEQVEQVDPFADEDDNKENQEPPARVAVEETSEDESPAEEWLAFDERNSGMGFDLMEEELDF